MSKFVKVIFSNGEGNYNYKIGEVNSTDNWNVYAEKGRDFGGFNYCDEDSIIRWLHRGDTICDVEVPEDAENVKIEGSTTIYRCNKIILTNPRKVTDDLALYYYKISNIPEVSYYKALGAVSIMGYRNTALALLRDKVNKDNIITVLNEWNDFMIKGSSHDRSNGLVDEINGYLKEIESDLLISICVDKDPYIKDFSSDKIINITGESGSGKSTYTDKFLDDDNFIVIDTDLIFGNKETNNKYCLEIREYLKNKYNDKLDRNKDFNIYYKEILDYYKDSDKTLIIDSAQFRNLKGEDLKLLKGKIIIMRTCIDTCMERCINRWKNKMKDYTIDELNAYIERKPLYRWYKNLNNFIVDVDNL